MVRHTKHTFYAYSTNKKCINEPQYPPTAHTLNHKNSIYSKVLTPQTDLASSLLTTLARSIKEDVMHTLILSILVATLPLILLTTIISLSETIKKRHGKRIIKKAAAGALRGLAQGVQIRI
jgi:hypothetical protein